MTRTDRALSLFDEYMLRNSTIDMEIRDMLLETKVTTARLDLFSDIDIIHLDLNDELHEMTLMLIYDRENETPHELRALIDTQLITIYDDGYNT